MSSLWGDAARADAAGDSSVERIRQAGVLRHLGAPYARFITGGGDGLDVELAQGFAQYLGVRYAFVRSDWDHIIPDLLGREVSHTEDEAQLGAGVPVRGDLIASGLTVLAWRTRVLQFSPTTFPTGVWLIAAAEHPLHPIVPTGDRDADIALVKKMLGGVSVLTKNNTCLDHTLYDLDVTGARIHPTPASVSVNELAPAVMDGMAETSLLDVPDALVALEKWPGRIKVIGPVSGPQTMAVAFRPEDKALHAAFETYFAELVSSGAYRRMVERYYPAIFSYFPHFLGR
ncbi:putative ABC transporter, periplasmic substrate-binding protein [Magnetofaba australis IT-1]|uniref:Putative ABC transporter, periplasmic substrate-binding protein n=1 Tax=Magnetofaba australis IT-1 TaxID=1434232 RepID=A0A1Y2K3S2_9PROT|nr:putative ABC transporter, periplasmic substrate-binding protein [Magnetofaba australis IT-1]